MNTFKSYLPLCWLKANPLDLPHSIAFLKQNFWFYYLVELFIQANMIDPLEAAVEVTIETALTFSFIALIMFLNRNFQHFVPVVSSILFCENVVAFFGVPVVVWLTVTDSLISYYILGGLILWDYILIAYILRKTLGINIAASLTLSFFYFMMTYAGAYFVTIMIF